jgi:hypothetical protein
LASQLVSSCASLAIMVRGAVGRKKRTWKNKDVRMTGCTKIFVQPVVVMEKIAVKTP